MCLCLLPRPARGSEATGRRQAPASFVQALCLVHFCRRLGVPGGWATRASRVPGGTQDPEQSFSLLGPCGISNRRALGGSSCSEGLCLSSDGLWLPAPVWRDSHEVLSLREETAIVSLVRWSPAVSVCDCVSVCAFIRSPSSLGFRVGWDDPSAWPSSPWGESSPVLRDPGRARGRKVVRPLWLPSPCPPEKTWRMGTL